ncbi:MAG: hypothetical protein FJX29_00910 [Alphaproteobacteria bacterium]|nr:hypothetical protein [Alphaproteobacteria bacterium]
MLPWIHLDTTKAPGGGDMRLIRRGGEFSIMLGNIALMNSRLSGSEVAMAQLSAARLAHKAAPAVLIGGLGMGFTLRAALEAFPGEAAITVAELVPAVAQWARGPMAELFGDCLDDRRVTLKIADAGALIREAKNALDAILLDTDNGPEGLTRPANDALYSAAGLAAAMRALRPGGHLAIWSQGPDEKFSKRLKRAGFEADEERVRAHRGKRGARHVIWFARKQ